MASIICEYRRILERTYTDNLSNYFRRIINSYRLITFELKNSRLGAQHFYDPNRCHQLGRHRTQFVRVLLDDVDQRRETFDGEVFLVRKGPQPAGQLVQPEKKIKLVLSRCRKNQELKLLRSNTTRTYF